MKTKLLLLFAVVIAAFSMNAQINSIAIVGEAVGGWPGQPGNPGPTDVNQLTNIGGTMWRIENLAVTTAAAGGGAKFRANNSWDFPLQIWGSTAFPTAASSPSPGDNILTTFGTYTVTFDSSNGAYSFTGGVPTSLVKIIGTAVSAAGGITMSPQSATTFNIPVTTFLTGTAQFEIDGVLYGGSAFPMGMLAAAATPLINVIGAEYTTVTINIGSGEYAFVAAPVFPSVAIVGNGAGGWPGEPGNPGPLDVHQLTTTNGELYKINTVPLTASPGMNEIKFRANNAWMTSWGGGSFPAGPTVAGDNITVTTAGLHRANFTRSTGAYNFNFPTVAIVGEAVGGWPGTPGNPGPTDVNQLTTTDGETYTINNLVVTTAAAGGGAKFRYDNVWTDVNSGGASFPTSTTSNGDNIPTVAGTYNVTFTRSTGGYNFAAVTFATTSFDKLGFKVSPNPTQNSWNFTSSKEAIVSIQVIDMLGKVVATSTSADVDASTLNTGVYFAKVTTSSATATIKVVRN